MPENEKSATERERVESTPCVLCGETVVVDRWTRDGVEYGEVVKPCKCGTDDA